MRFQESARVWVGGEAGGVGRAQRQGRPTFPTRGGIWVLDFFVFQPARLGATLDASGTYASRSWSGYCSWFAAILSPPWRSGGAEARGGRHASDAHARTHEHPISPTVPCVRNEPRAWAGKRLNSPCVKRFWQTLFTPLMSMIVVMPPLVSRALESSSSQCRARCVRARVVTADVVNAPAPEAVSTTTPTFPTKFSANRGAAAAPWGGSSFGSVQGD